MVEKIKIKNISWDSYCPLCGLNTLLLPDKERIKVGNEFFCRYCYEKGDNKKSVTPKDFFDLWFQNREQYKDFCLQISLEASVRCKLPRINVAHLYGEFYKEDDFRLDLYYDEMNNKPYFRISIADDDDHWFGRESYSYVSVKHAVFLLNKNRIHIWDDMNESNWKDFFDFQDRPISNVSKIKECFKKFIMEKKL